jgi:hypothetical protein
VLTLSGVQRLGTTVIALEPPTKSSATRTAMKMNWQRLMLMGSVSVQRTPSAANSIFGLPLVSGKQRCDGERLKGE